MFSGGSLAMHRKTFWDRDGSCWVYGGSFASLNRDKGRKVHWVFGNLITIRPRQTHKGKGEGGGGEVAPLVLHLHYQRE